MEDSWVLLVCRQYPFLYLIVLPTSVLSAPNSMIWHPVRNAQWKKVKNYNTFVPIHILNSCMITRQ